MSKLRRILFLLRRLRNRPFIIVASFLGMAVIAIGNFTGAIVNVLDFSDRIDESSKRQEAEPKAAAPEPQLTSTGQTHGSTPICDDRRFRVLSVLVTQEGVWDSEYPEMTSDMIAGHLEMEILRARYILEQEVKSGLVAMRQAPHSDALFSITTLGIGRLSEEGCL